MNKFRFFAIVALFAIAFLAPAAFAQTPANISIISGNGQVICQLCVTGTFALDPFFSPLFVKVTDANGNPVPGATITWNVLSGNGTFAINGSQTFAGTTDSNGNANILYSAESIILPSLNPDLVSTVSATIANNASATFYLTQGLAGSNYPNPILVNTYSPASIPPCSNCLNPGETLTGAAGSTSSDQFEVQVYSEGANVAVPNVSLRLVPNQTSPTISCATGAGADPGSVLTNAFGIAICTPVLGSGTGSGSFTFLVGGTTGIYSVTGGPVGFQSGNFSLVVTPGVPGMISIAGGNNQGGNPGQPLSSVLQATVGDSSGNPLSGQQVVWTVSPAGAATLSNTSTTSNGNGQVQTNLTLSNTASGTIQVTVALAGNPSISATFTVSANIQVSGLQIVSGNPQSAVIGATFAPLVVQLATNNGALSNITVAFSIAGPGTLTATSATTNSSGQASVDVVAGSATGTITVTASVGSFNVKFNLTVIPPGPTLSSGSFYNGADFQQGSISPCGIATIIAPGVASAIQGAVAYDGVGGLPYLLAGDAVTIGGAQAPIYNVANVNGQQQLTFQVPCSVTPGTNSVTVNVGGGSGSANVTVLPASPGLFSTQVSTTTLIPVLERPDGSFVSPTNPARRGETVIGFVTGLGPTSPAVGTNSVPIPGSTATVQGTVIVGVNGNGASLISATLSPDIVGVFEIAFVVPSSIASGTNTDFSIGLLPQGSSKVYYSSLGYFPVQ